MHTDELILQKSEKKSQKKNVMISRIIMGLAVAVFFIATCFSYIHYKNAQKLIVDTVYNLLAAVDDGVYYYDDDINDTLLVTPENDYDLKYSALVEEMKYGQHTREKVSKALYGACKLIETKGYSPYYPNNKHIGSNSNYLKCSNFFSWFITFSWYNLIVIFCYFVFILSIAFTLITKYESKKELIINEDNVICKINQNKSKQLTYNDISNVEQSKDSLKIIGDGIKFQISNLKNAESLRQIILEKKTSFDKASTVTNFSTSSNADELKKYKDLLDSGAISQEEFDAKKKDLLGL